MARIDPWMRRRAFHLDPRRMRKVSYVEALFNPLLAHALYARLESRSPISQWASRNPMARARHLQLQAEVYFATLAVDRLLAAMRQDRTSVTAQDIRALYADLIRIAREIRTAQAAVPSPASPDTVARKEAPERERG